MASALANYCESRFYSRPSNVTDYSTPVWENEELAAAYAIAEMSSQERPRGGGKVLRSLGPYATNWARDLRKSVDRYRHLSTMSSPRSRWSPLSSPRTKTSQRKLDYGNKHPAFEVRDCQKYDAVLSGEDTLLNVRNRVENRQQVSSGIFSNECASVLQMKSLPVSPSPVYESSNKLAEDLKTRFSNMKTEVGREIVPNLASLLVQSGEQLVSQQRLENYDVSENDGGVFVRTARLVDDDNVAAFRDARVASFHLAAPFNLSRSGRAYSDRYVTHRRAEKAPVRHWTVSGGDLKPDQYHYNFPKLMQIDPSNPTPNFISRQDEAVVNTQLWMEKKNVKMENAEFCAGAEVETSLPQKVSFGRNSPSVFLENGSVPHALRIEDVQQGVNVSGLHNPCSPLMSSVYNGMKRDIHETSLEKSINPPFTGQAAMKQPLWTEKPAASISPRILGRNLHSSVTLCSPKSYKEENLSPANWVSMKSSKPRAQHSRANGRKSRTVKNIVRCGRPADEYYDAVPAKMENFSQSFLVCNDTGAISSLLKLQQQKTTKPRDRLASCTTFRRVSPYNLHSDAVQKASTALRDANSRSKSTNIPSGKYFSDYLRQKTQTSSFGVLESLRDYYQLLDEKNGGSRNVSHLPMDLSKHRRIMSKENQAADSDEDDKYLKSSIPSREDQKDNYDGRKSDSSFEFCRDFPLRAAQCRQTSSPLPPVAVIKTENIPVSHLDGETLEHPSADSDSQSRLVIIAEETLARNTKSPSATLMRPDCQLPPKKRRMFDRCKAEDLNASEPVVDLGVVKKEVEVSGEGEGHVSDTDSVDLVRSSKSHITLGASNPDYTKDNVKSFTFVSNADEDGDLPLHIAVVQGKLSVVDRLLSVMQEMGVSIDAVNHQHQTSLHLAVITNQCDIVERLLRATASTSLTDLQGNGLLHLAVKYNSMDCLRLLLSSLSTPGCPLLDVNAMNHEGLTALHLAVQYNRTEAVLALLESACANVNSPDGKNGRTALYFAAEVNDLRVTQILLAHGADPLIASYSGCTPAQMASGRSHFELLKLLERNVVSDMEK